MPSTSSTTFRLAQRELRALGPRLDEAALCVEERFAAFDALTGRMVAQRFGCHPGCFHAKPIDEDAFDSSWGDLSGCSGHLRVSAQPIVRDARALMEQGTALLGQACNALSSVPMPIPHVAVQFYAAAGGHQKGVVPADDKDVTMFGLDGHKHAFGDLFDRLLDLAPGDRDPWFLFDGTIWRGPLAIHASTPERAHTAYTLLVPSHGGTTVPPILQEAGSQKDLLAAMAANPLHAF